jgi:hypothetical protein
MPRIAQRDFSSGLVITPPREAGPPNSLRQSIGLRNPALSKSIRSRWGAVKLLDYALNFVGGTLLHSIVRFQDARYVGLGTHFFNEQGAVFSLPNLNGNKLTFVEGIPVTGQGRQHWMIVAGGGQPFKVRSGLLVARNVGIVPPATSFTGASIAFTPGVNVLQWDAFDVGEWIISGNPADKNVQLAQAPLGTTPPGGSVSGTSLIAQTAHRNDVGAFFRPAGINFGFFSLGSTSAPSSDQDWIVFDVMVDKPLNLDKLVIRFGVADDNAGLFPATFEFPDSYTFEVRVDDTTVRAQTLGPTGLGDLGAVRQDQTAAVQPADVLNSQTAPPPSKQFTKAALDSIAVTTISSVQFQWTRLRIPKASFTRGNVNTDKDWHNINAVGFEIVTNDGPDTTPTPMPVTDPPGLLGPSNRGCAVYLANGLMQGGTGMQGDYSYRVTYKNHETGTRSNPNVTGAVIVKDVPRTGVQLSGLPVSPDPQVTLKEIWRTVGNGSVWFLAATIANVSHDFEDHIADFEAMLDLDPPPTVLSNEEIQFDNVIPYDQFTLVGPSHIAGPLNGQVFWTRDKKPGNEGRWYFSPIGRLECHAGFLELGSRSDPMQLTIIWNGTVYAASIDQWWEMQGQGVDWVGRPVFGVPGTKYPFSAVATPYGIAYLAQDGVRIFDGNSSSLVGADRMLVRFRGEVTDGNTPPFPSATATDQTVCASYFHDEYILTDGQTTLAVDLRTGAWREVGGPGFEAIYREPETNLLLVGTDRMVWSWEQPGALDDVGAAIAFAIATPALVPNAGIVATLAQRLYVDCNTRGETLQALIFRTDDSLALGGGAFPITTASRQTVEIALGSPIGAGYVTLTGELRNIVDVFALELDLHIPEQPGQGT